MDNEVANAKLIVDKDANRVKIRADFQRSPFTFTKGRAVKAEMVQIDLCVLIVDLEA